MNGTSELNLTIPAEIMALPNCSLSERVALTYVAKHPTCTNAGIGRLLGISERGAEALLRRLRRLGYIVAVGNGRARNQRLTFAVGPPQECGIAVPPDSHKNCGPVVAPPMLPARQLHSIQAQKSETSPLHDFLTSHLVAADSCAEFRQWDAALHHLRQVKERLAEEKTLSSAQKSKATEIVTVHENRMYAWKMGWEIVQKLPSAKKRALVRTICAATPEQLARFRQLVDQEKLVGNPLDILMLPPGNG